MSAQAITTGAARAMPAGAPAGEGHPGPLLLRRCGTLRLPGLPLESNHCAEPDSPASGGAALPRFPHGPTSPAHGLTAYPAGRPFPLLPHSGAAGWPARPIRPAASLRSESARSWHRLLMSAATSRLPLPFAGDPILCRGRRRGGLHSTAPSKLADAQTVEAPAPAARLTAQDGGGRPRAPRQRAGSLLHRPPGGASTAVDGARLPSGSLRSALRLAISSVNPWKRPKPRSGVCVTRLFTSLYIPCHNNFGRQTR